MGLRINNNIAALNSYNAVNKTDKAVSSSLEKLSSGYRINKAADDAAGLVISEGLRSQVGGLTVAARNAQDGVNVVQTADGALGTITTMLQRMRDLAVQASNGTADANAKTAAQSEFSALSDEITRIAGATSFGSLNLLNGSFSQAPSVVSGAITGAGSGVTLAATTGEFTLDFATGFTTVTAAIDMAGTYSTAANYATALQSKVDSAILASNPATYKAGDVTATVVDNGAGVWTVSLSAVKGGAITIADATGTAAAAGLGAARTVALPGGTARAFQVGANAGQTIGINITAADAVTLGVSGSDLTSNASAAITAVNSAITTVSGSRASLGALQNRFEYAINNLSVSIENITASESAIRDTDMAAEMTKFTKNQILSQAGTSMLAQANSSTQNILTLLRG